MNQAPATKGVSAELLEAHLRRDAGAREASIVGFMRWITPATMVMALSLWPLLGREHALWLAGTLGLVSLYYWAQSLFLRRGFRPWMPFANVAVEVSAPAALYLFDLHFQGALYALTAPPIFVWATLILLSALRSNQRLAVFAGGLAALEYLLLYFVLTQPHLEPGTLITLTPPFVLIRVFLLFAAGVATAIIAGHFIRLSTETLRVIREEDVMGKYQLEARIGEGGMAEVFRAVYCPEGGFRKLVAVKRIHPTLTGDPKFVEMFRRETYLGSLLSHPNLVQVYDAGRFQARYFMSMEYVDGLSLGAALVALDRPLPLAAASYLGAEIADGLFYLHNREDENGKQLGLVHRDVNPPNILITRRGEVKLADFGITRGYSSDEFVTAVGDVRGKLRFMAPEQLRGEPLDGRTDIFSLGLTLYLALTGKSMFRGENVGALRTSVLNQEPSPVSHARADVPPELDVAIQGLLRRERATARPPGRSCATGCAWCGAQLRPIPTGRPSSPGSFRTPWSDSRIPR